MSGAKLTTYDPQLADLCYHWLYPHHTGSMIVTWLGEQITDKGYGNGTSIVIFAGIISSLPTAISEIYQDRFVNIDSSRMTESIIFVSILAVAVLACVYFTTYVQQAEYKIPIQYTKRAQGLHQFLLAAKT